MFHPLFLSFNQVHNNQLHLSSQRPHGEDRNEHMNSVTISRVHKYLGEGAQRTHVLKGTSLEVDEGEFLGISGKSGSGKTTLLRAIAGLLPTDEGSISVFDTLSLIHISEPTRPAA